MPKAACWRSAALQRAIGMAIKRWTNSTGTGYRE
jgi:hypothetical protein